MPFLVAAALVRGRLTLAELENDALGDAAILGVASKVSYRPDPDSPFPKAYSGELVVTLDDGRELRHREHINRGAADRPLSNADIVDKYRSNAAMAVHETAASRIADAVLGLDQAPRAADALSVLSPSVR